MATNVWLGHADAIAQVQDATISGTWANGDTATVTINGKDVTYTVSGLTGDPHGYILTALAAALNVSAIPEFAEQTWSNAGNTTLRGIADTAGKPWSATTSVVTAGDGNLSSFAMTVENAGPCSVNTADNWSLGHTPANTEDVVFENSETPCLYDLDALAAIIPGSLTIKQSFCEAGLIGLPRVNEDDSDNSYVEYRQAYLQMGPTTVTIGEGEGTGSGRIKLDFGANDAAITVYGHGQREEAEVPCVLLKGTNSSNSLTIIKGDVGVAIFAGETANLSGGLSVGHETSQLGDAQLICGSGVTLVDVEQSGGRMAIESNVTNYTQHAGQLTPRGSATITTGKFRGTVYDYSSGAFGIVYVLDGGDYDHTRSMIPKTIASLGVYKGGAYRDPYGVITETNGICVMGCKHTDVTIEKPAHQKLTFADI